LGVIAVLFRTTVLHGFWIAGPVFIMHASIFLFGIGVLITGQQLRHAVVCVLLWASWRG
jgi:hypothetical protein